MIKQNDGMINYDRSGPILEMLTLAMVDIIYKFVQIANPKLIHLILKFVTMFLCYYVTMSTVLFFQIIVK